LVSQATVHGHRSRGPGLRKTIPQRVTDRFTRRLDRWGGRRLRQLPRAELSARLYPFDAPA
jgi:hypothetical protein